MERLKEPEQTYATREAIRNYKTDKYQQSCYHVSNCTELTSEQKVFIFYTDSYKVPRPVEHLAKDDYEMYMYTTNPDLEEKKEDRKRK